MAQVARILGVSAKVKEAIKILIVDDSKLVRMILRSTLEEEKGIIVVGEASNGREAINMTRWLRPHVVTMDIEMPEMNGIEACEQLHKEFGEEVRVIMLSSYPETSPYGVLESRRGGAVDFVEKRQLSMDQDAESLKILMQKIQFWGIRALETQAADGVAEVPVALQTDSFVNASDFRAPVDALVIGASTNGPMLILELLSSIVPFPIPIVIALHCGEDVAPIYSHHLSEELGHPVVVASENHAVSPGEILVIPSYPPLGFTRNGEITYLLSRQEIPGDSPNITDVLTTSLQGFDCPLALILSGLGNDGSEALIGYHEAKAPVAVIDPNTVSISGMPKAALETGYVNCSGTLTEIIIWINSLNFKRFTK